MTADNLPTWEELALSASEILEELDEDYRRQNHGNRWRGEMQMAWQVHDWLSDFRRVSTARKAASKEVKT